MNRDGFWKLIEANSAEDCYEHAENVQLALSKLSAEEIAAFSRQMREVEAESYTWELWGAAYLINGGCSDDGFDYFRGWLMTMGRSVFEQALKNPDSLADIEEVEEEVECEDILYVGMNAYEKVAGEELPITTFEMPELGESWDFDEDDEMQKRYPRLFKKFA